MAEVDEADWATVAEAAATTGAAPRTVYAWAERGQVPHRADDGRMLVQLSAVQARAARRALQSQPIARAQRGDAEHASAAESEDVKAARDRIELAKLAAEQARAERDRLGAQQELAEATSAVQRAAAEGELGFRRATLEADDMALRLERQRATEAARARDQAARATIERERARRKQADENRRQRWSAEWVAWAVEGANTHLGGPAAVIAAQTVKQALTELTPETPHTAVAALLDAKLTLALTQHIEAKRSAQLAQARARLVEQALRQPIVRERSAEGRTAAREAAEAEAARVNVATEAAADRVSFAARAVAREHKNREDRAADQEWRARHWRELYGELPEMSQRLLPCDATAADRESLLGQLRSLYQKIGPCLWFDFNPAARAAAAPIVARVKERREWSIRRRDIDHRVRMALPWRSSEEERTRVARELEQLLDRCIAEGATPHQYDNRAKRFLVRAGSG